MKTIVLTGGGTAGHCTPHFAVIPYLYKHFDKIYYIASEGGIEENLVKDKNISVFLIHPTKLRRTLTVKNLGIPFKMLSSISEAEKILKQLKPKVVFSKGGYVGLPVTIAAKRLNIPVVIHESDLSVGLANKIASRFATTTLTSFKETALTVKNGMFVGTPIRSELFEINRRNGLEYYGFSGKKPVLLITGGSSGAKFLNEITLECLNKLLKTFDVLHVTGKNNLSGISASGYVETEFTDMKYAYACADLCVSRAGSNTAFEIIIKNIPVLFIPLPKTQSRGDQIDNAEYFLKRNLAHVLYQENAYANTFYNEIMRLYQNSNEIRNAQKHFNYPLANKKIADILNKY